MNSSVMVVKKTILLLVIPVLAVLSIGLFVCMIVSVIGGLLYTLGSGVNMELWPNLTVPSYLGLPIGVVFGTLLLVIARCFWKVLNYFIKTWNV